MTLYYERFEYDITTDEIEAYLKTIDIEPSLITETLDEFYTIEDFIKENTTELGEEYRDELTDFYEHDARINEQRVKQERRMMHPNTKTYRY